MDIKEKILSDPVNRWVFRHAERECYLVGGYVRDILRGREPGDKDFILRHNAEELARHAASRFRGSFIELQKDQTYRVALNSRAFIDFSILNNGVLEDLNRRDFTVNAIAWSPGSGFVAPPDHLDDVRNREIRVIHQKNLTDDPLRIFRAYRLSAQLEFSIESQTRKYLKKYAKELKRAAPERITGELFRMLNSHGSSQCLRQCLDDNVISGIIPLTYYNIDDNIALISRFDHFTEHETQFRRNTRLYEQLHSVISQGLIRSGLIRLHLLLRDTEHTRSGDKSSVPLIKKLKFIRLSKKITKCLGDLVTAGKCCTGRVTETGLFNMYRHAGDCVYEIALIKSMMRPQHYQRMTAGAERFLKTKHMLLLNGHEIKKILKTESGERIGTVKERILENQFYGNIRNRSEAREFVLSNFT